MNEVHFIEYLSENTTIPVPRVTSWGRTEESPQHLGPFIIMDFIPGERLTDILRQPSGEDDVILNPEVDDSVLDVIYEQLADYMLQLSEHSFSAIGAISKDHASNTWSVTGRPLTYNMNELATVSYYPMDRFPNAPFTSAAQYFLYLADEHLRHFRTQRNLAIDSEDAERRYIARNRFRKLISRYGLDDSQFKIFCDDLQPTNMLVNKETLQITAILDWEFTNTMPAQYANDAPWWLLLLGPDMFLEWRSYTEFVTRYEPRLEQFLRALKRVEAKLESLGTKTTGAMPLSDQMRDSWASKRFWFNYGMKKSFDIDAIYWSALHQDDEVEELARADLDSVRILKMNQLKAYEEDRLARLAEK
jgi:hypothetical protein